MTHTYIVFAYSILFSHYARIFIACYSVVSYTCMYGYTNTIKCKNYKLNIKKKHLRKFGEKGFK